MGPTNRPKTAHAHPAPHNLPAPFLHLSSEAKEKNREGWYMAYIMDTNEEERVKGITVEVSGGLVPGSH